MIHKPDQKNRDGYRLFQKKRGYRFYRQHVLTAIHAQVYFPTNNSGLFFVRRDNEKPLTAYVVSVMDNSLFSGKDQRSYYFLPNSAESISLLRGFVLALQLDINIHTIIRCYYYCCSLLVFWGS